MDVLLTRCHNTIIVNLGPTSGLSYNYIRDKEDVLDYSTDINCLWSAKDLLYSGSCQITQVYLGFYEDVNNFTDAFSFRVLMGKR